MLILNEWEQQCQALMVYLEDAVMAHNDDNRLEKKLKLQLALTHCDWIKQAIKEELSRSK